MAISQGKIGNALASTADNAVVALASAIYDEKYDGNDALETTLVAGSYLSAINKDHKTRIAALETNSGSVTGPTTSTNGAIALFNGTNGKTLKNATTVGSATRPIYISSTGVPTAGTYTFGNASGNAPISNGTVNVNLNADKVDGWNATGNTGAVLIKSGLAHSSTASLESYWSKLADFTISSTEDKEVTLYLHSEYNQLYGLLNIGIRTTTTGYWTRLRMICGNIPVDRIRLYRDGDPGTQFELWVNTNARYGVLNARVLSETDRAGSERSDIVTLTNASFTEAQTPTLTEYINPTYVSLLNPSDTATKLATARTITLTGDTAGSASFDGSTNASITTKTNASSLKSVNADAMTVTPNVYYHKGNDFVSGGAEVSNQFSVPSNSVDASSKNGQVLRMYWSNTYYTDFFTSPNNHGTKTGLFYRQRVNTTMYDWRMLLDTMNYKTVMDTATSTSNGLMSSSDFGALQELIAKTISVSISGTGARFSGVAGNISTTVSKLSSLEVTKLELLSGTTNNPTTVANTYTDKAATKSVSVAPTATTYYRWRATINGTTYQSSVGTVTIVEPIYMGFGASAAAVKTDANKHTTAVTTAKGLTLSRTNSTNTTTNLYLLIPTSGVTKPTSIKSGGAPVAFTTDTTSVSGYTTYKLGATYNNGTVASVELS